MSKITDLSNISAVDGADSLLIADASASTSDVNVTLDQIKTFVNTAPVIAAGTASANTWPKLTAGTLLTTAEDGAIEIDGDCLYGCTDAGNRGVIPIEHFIRCDSVRNLASQTAAQAIFNSPTNGRITLETGLYEFEGFISVSALSATSGNAQILFAGTGTFAAWLWHAFGVDGSTATAATQTGSTMVTSSSPASVVTAGTGTGLQVNIHGTFECTAAGTLIPQIALVTAAAGVVAIGSFLKVKRIGSTTVVSVGQWD